MESKLHLSKGLENVVHDEYKLNKLYAIALQITKDVHMSEDVVQDSLIKAMKHYPKLKDKGKISSWLIQIVRNTAINTKTKQGSQNNKLVFDTLLENKASDEKSVEKNVEQQMTKEFVERLLTNLKPEFRQVVIMRYKKDSTLKEISRELNISLGTVKSRLNRSKLKIKNML